MKRKFNYSLMLLLGLATALVWHVTFSKENTGVVEYYAPGQIIEESGEPAESQKEEIEEEPEAVQTKVNIDVPYMNEAPDNKWVGSWKNACEEASITMVQEFYAGSKVVNIPDAKVYMQTLFTFQQRQYGSDADSDAERSLAIINKHGNYNGTIVEDPTIEQIKEELRQGRPVIAFHRGFDLHNKNIPFLAVGSSYHSTVIKGYDDELGVFITNDPGDTKEGHDHTYTYNLYMNSLHDFNYVTRLADGPPRVIFTSPK